MGSKSRPKANHEIAERVTPLGQAREALEYYCSGVAAEDRLRLPHKDYAISPVYFLLGHSIELSFKSLLRKSGMTPDEYSMRRIGHDLSSCLKHAETADPAVWNTLTELDRSDLVTLNIQYSNKGLEYFGNGTVLLPPFQVARNLSRKILLIAIREIPTAEGLLRGKMREIFDTCDTLDG